MVPHSGWLLRIEEKVESRPVQQIAREDGTPFRIITGRTGGSKFKSDPIGSVEKIFLYSGHYRYYRRARLQTPTGIGGGGCSAAQFGATTVSTGGGRELWGPTGSGGWRYPLAATAGSTVGCRVSSGPIGAGGGWWPIRAHYSECSNITLNLIFFYMFVSGILGGDTFWDTSCFGTLLACCMCQNDKGSCAIFWCDNYLKSFCGAMLQILALIVQV
jgi:hypothetical protein